MSTHTVLSLLYHVRLAVNDLDSSGGVTSAGVWLPDNGYNGFIAQGLISDETAYTFTKRATGLWTADGFGGNPYALRFASDTTPFTSATNSNVYVSDAMGSITTSGTDTTASYSVSAAVVDFAHVMSELYWWLANHRCLQIATQSGAYVGETAKLLRDASGFWDGIRSPEMQSRLRENGGVLRRF